jgi:TetR/AcrR family tetracycline transcriptional repressor
MTRSPGRPPVPRDRIIDTALRIVDEHGADALSMRALAQELNSGTATLYRHFANRSQLIAHVVDRVFGEVQVDSEKLATLGWQQACKSVAQSMFDVLLRHPNVAPLLVEEVPVGPNALAQRERLMAILLDNGFAPELAARSYATLARYVLGFAIQLADRSILQDTRLAGLFHELDPQFFPATVTVADHLPVPLEDEFTFGLDLIVDGLDRRRKC